MELVLLDADDDGLISVRFFVRFNDLFIGGREANEYKSSAVVNTLVEFVL